MLVTLTDNVMQGTAWCRLTRTASNSILNEGCNQDGHNQRGFHSFSLSADKGTEDVIPMGEQRVMVRTVLIHRTTAVTQREEVPAYWNTIGQHEHEA